MKIIKKARIKPCRCKHCASVFQPTWRDVKRSSRAIKEKARCPVCKGWNLVSFEERTEEVG